VGMNEGGGSRREFYFREWDIKPEVCRALNSSGEALPLQSALRVLYIQDRRPQVKCFEQFK